MNTRAEQRLTTFQRILAVATRMFAQQGFEETSIEKLLEELQISRGALYHHFDSKEKIFRAVFEAVESDIEAAIVNATRGIVGPMEALRTGCDTFLKMVRDEPVRRIVLIDAPTVLGWQQWREIDARHGFGLLRKSLQVAAAEGRIRPELIDIYAHMLLASLMETALVIARANNSAATTRNGRAAITELIGKLLGEPKRRKATGDDE
jgi:AcrR family transcriptional regulator